MSHSGKIIVLITGANQGIGYETAKNLVQSSASYHVILGSRDSSKGVAAAQALQVQALADSDGVKAATKGTGTASSVSLDVTDEASIAAAAERVAADFGRLDVLVNNAGIIISTETASGGPPTAQALRRVLETNVVGALAVTEAFLDLLLLRNKAERSKPVPRLVFVSSSMGSITHAADPASPYYNNPHGTEYRTSKAALNMLMTMYSARLKPEGVLVIGADPGLCATNFTGDAASLRNRGAAEPADGGDRVAAVIKGEKDADAGRVIGVYGVSPW